MNVELLISLATSVGLFIAGAGAAYWRLGRVERDFDELCDRVTSAEKALGAVDTKIAKLEAHDTHFEAVIKEIREFMREVRDELRGRK